MCRRDSTAVPGLLGQYMVALGVDGDLLGDQADVAGGLQPGAWSRGPCPSSWASPPPARPAAAAASDAAPYLSDAACRALPNTSVFFARVPPSVPEDAVRELFERHGDVLEFKLYRRWPEAKNSKGCGLVTYKCALEASAALKALNGTHVWPGYGAPDAPMVVEWAHETPSGAGKPSPDPSSAGKASSGSKKNGKGSVDNNSASSRKAAPLSKAADDYRRSGGSSWSASWGSMARQWGGSCTREAATTPQPHQHPHQYLQFMTAQVQHLRQQQQQAQRRHHQQQLLLTPQQQQQQQLHVDFQFQYEQSLMASLAAMQMDAGAMRTAAAPLPPAVSQPLAGLQHHHRGTALSPHGPAALEPMPACSLQPFFGAHPAVEALALFPAAADPAAAAPAAAPGLMMMPGGYPATSYDMPGVPARPLGAAPGAREAWLPVSGCLTDPHSDRSSGSSGPLGCVLPLTTSFLAAQHAAAQQQQQQQHHHHHHHQQQQRHQGLMMGGAPPLLVMLDDGLASETACAGLGSPADASGPLPASAGTASRAAAAAGSSSGFDCSGSEGMFGGQRLPTATAAARCSGAGLVRGPPADRGASASCGANALPAAWDGASAGALLSGSACVGSLSGALAFQGRQQALQPPLPQHHMAARAAAPPPSPPPNPSFAPAAPAPGGAAAVAAPPALPPLLLQQQQQAMNLTLTESEAERIVGHAMHVARLSGARVSLTMEAATGSHHLQLAGSAEEIQAACGLVHLVL